MAVSLWYVLNNHFHAFGAASSVKFALLLPFFELTEGKFYDPRSTSPAKQENGFRFIVKMHYSTHDTGP